MQAIKRKDIKNLTFKQQVDILEKACEMFKTGFELFDNSSEIYKKIPEFRAFDDVLHYNNSLYISINPQQLNNEPRNENAANTLVTIWHELGHLVVSTPAERRGKHWISNKLLKLEESNAKRIKFCENNEELAVGASYYLMYLFGLPKQCINWVDNVTGGDYNGNHAIKKENSDRSYSVDDLDYFEFSKGSKVDFDVIKICNDFFQSFKETYPGMGY